MLALYIDPSEVNPPCVIAPPRAGASLAEWAAYRKAARAAGVYRVAMTVARRERDDVPPEARVWPRRSPTPVRAPTADLPIAKSTALPPSILTPIERLEVMVRAPLSHLGEPSIAFIIRACCSFYYVSRTDLIGQRRTLKIIRPRHVAMYLARRLTTHSLPTIGWAFGDRDHTTILHGFRRIEAAIKVDAELLAEVETIMGAVLGGEKP